MSECLYSSLQSRRGDPEEDCEDRESPDVIANDEEEIEDLKEEHELMWDRSNLTPIPEESQQYSPECWETLFDNIDELGQGIDDLVMAIQDSSKDIKELGLDLKKGGTINEDLKRDQCSFSLNDKNL